MSTDRARSMVHRGLGLLVGATVLAYAGYGLWLGAFFVPERGTDLSYRLVPLWAAERAWLAITGVPGALLLLGAALFGTGAILRPAPQAADAAATARLESWARAALLSGGLIGFAGLVGSVFAPGDPTPSTVTGLHALQAREQATQAAFAETKAFWSVLLLVAAVAFLVDLVLRHRARRARPSFP